jgi:hypothetical protein
VNYDVAYPGPMLDETYFPTTAAALGPTAGIQGAAFWTSTSLGYPYTVVFYSGAYPGELVTETNYTPTTRDDLRCVRGGTGPFAFATKPSDAPPGRYTTPSAGVVFDTKTKLAWQQTPTATTADGGTYPSFSFVDARTYCGGLSLDGGGWRVPTVRELSTLVDWSRAPSLGSKPAAIDQTFFPGTPNDFADMFWSATPVAGDPASAWYVGFDHGEACESERTNALYVRCVR